MDETLSLDDLLRLDDNDEEVEVEIEEIEDTTTTLDEDPDLWDLEQKLTSGDTTSTITAAVATATAPVVFVAMKQDDESESTKAHADAELSLSKLQQENFKLQQQMKNLQTTKNAHSPPIEVASVDDLLHRIHDLELETTRAHHVTANLMEKIQNLEQINQKLVAENEELKETINRTLDPVETIELGPPFVVEEHGGPQTTTTTTMMIGELQGIIENLQARIMVLVEEKLDLQLRNDRLEHELKTSPSKQQHQFPMGWFSPPPPAAAAAVTPRLKDNVDNDDDDDGGGVGGGDDDHHQHGEHDHHGGDVSDDNGGGGEQSPQPTDLDPPHKKTTESSPAADFLLHQGAMIEKTKRDFGNALGGIFAKVASAGDFAKNRVGSIVPTGEPKPLDQKLEVTIEEEANRDGEEKPEIPTINPITVEDKTVDELESTKTSTLPNDGSPPRHGGGWNFFGIIKKKDVLVVPPVAQQGGDEDDFMSSPTRDQPNQRLLPAMSSDSLPSMLDLSRTKLVHVSELDEDTIDFDVDNNHSSDTKEEKAQREIFAPLEKLDLMGAAQNIDVMVTKTTNDTPRTDGEGTESLHSEHKIPQGVETLP